nr:cystatin domain-containing protein [Plesiomonas shigelloides]
MKKMLMVAALCAGLSGVSLSSYAAPAQKPLMGGWSAAEVIPQAKQAAEFAFKASNVSSTLDKVIAVQQQVVSGMNYKVIYQLADGSRWQAQVYRALDGHEELHALNRLPANQ